MVNNQINNEYVQKGYLKTYLANRGIKVISYEEWEHLCDCIDDAKAADVRENVHGEWDFMGFQMFQCSTCKHTFTQDHLESWKAYTYEPHFPNFCPNCGADMRGEP